MVRAFLYQNLTKTGTHNVCEPEEKKNKAEKKTDKRTLLYHMLLGDVN